MRRDFLLHQEKPPMGSLGWYQTNQGLYFNIAICSTYFYLAIVISTLLFLRASFHERFNSTGFVSP